MTKVKIDIGVGMTVVALAFAVACCIGSWLLNVYIVVKTAKWMGWL